MEQHGGLLHALPSRRDYFIAAALQGLLGEGLAEYQDVPQLAVDLADEVLRIAVSPAPAGSSGPPPAAQPPGPGDVAAHCDCGALPGMAHLSDCLSMVFVCEASFPGDAECSGELTLDKKTKGLFCPLHIAVEEVCRREMHRLHGHRNRRPG